MARHKRKGNGLPAQLAALNLHAAGIDSGAQEHWGAVPPDSDSPPVRRCGACKVELAALASGRQPWGLTTGVRESSGVDWRPRFEVREARGLTVV